MKKNNEGYVLAMVMCVIAVLAVVASAMLGVGLRNIQMQQFAVEQLEDRYAAEGAIEAVLAEYIEQLKTIKDEKKDIEVVKSTIQTICTDFESSMDTGVELRMVMEEAPWRIESETQRYLVFKLEAESETVKVCRDIEVYVELRKIENMTDKYEVKDLALIYKSYEMEVPNDEM